MSQQLMQVETTCQECGHSFLGNAHFCNAMPKKLEQLQAKYDALLRKFIGDSTLVIDYDIQSAIHHDIETARKKHLAEKQAMIDQFNMAVARAQEIDEANSCRGVFDKGNYFESTL